MPIRPELRSLYPTNWRTLSADIRFRRAQGRCEACGRPHGAVILCLPDGRWFDPMRDAWRDGNGRPAQASDLLDHPQRRSTRVMLAAAHCDHDPTNNRRRNLRALCQRCHLQHDRPQHRYQRWLTCRRRYALGDLFLGVYTELSAAAAGSPIPAIALNSGSFIRDKSRAARKRISWPPYRQPELTGTHD